MAKSAMRYWNGFTAQIFNKFDMYIRDRLVRILHFPDTIRQATTSKEKCSSCGGIGHRKNNKTLCTAAAAREVVMGGNGGVVASPAAAITATPLPLPPAEGQ